MCEDRSTSQLELVHPGRGGPAGGRREVQSPRGADVGGVSEVPADLSPGTPAGWSQVQPAGEGTEAQECG